MGRDEKGRLRAALENQNNKQQTKGGETSPHPKS